MCACVQRRECRGAWTAYACHAWQWRQDTARPRTQHLTMLFSACPSRRYCSSYTATPMLNAAFLFSRPSGDWNDGALLSCWAETRLARRKTYKCILAIIFSPMLLLETPLRLVGCCHAFLDWEQSWIFLGRSSASPQEAVSKWKNCNHGNSYNWKLGPIPFTRPSESFESTINEPRRWTWLEQFPCLQYVSTYNSISAPRLLKFVSSFYSKKCWEEYGWSYDGL